MNEFELELPQKIPILTYDMFMHTFPYIIGFLFKLFLVLWVIHKLVVCQMTILLALFSEMVHAKGEGVKYVQKTVHMVYSLNSFKTLIAMPKFEEKKIVL